jgi:transcription antitermination factor NusG
MTAPVFRFNNWVRVTAGAWTGETGFVKCISEERDMVQIEITGSSETLWFYRSKVEKFSPEI